MKTIAKASLIEANNIISPDEKRPGAYRWMGLLKTKE